MAAGTYSSICIATPLAAQLKESDPMIIRHTKKVLDRRAKREETASAEPVAAAPSRPVAPSGASKRSQPSRTPRSQRPKRGS